jgi:hypothetical protein
MSLLENHNGSHLNYFSSLSLGRQIVNDCARMTYCYYTFVVNAMICVYSHSYEASLFHHETIIARDTLSIVLDMSASLWHFKREKKIRVGSFSDRQLSQQITSLGMRGLKCRWELCSCLAHWGIVRTGDFIQDLCFQGYLLMFTYANLWTVYIRIASRLYRTTSHASTRCAQEAAWAATASSRNPKI